MAIKVRIQRKRETMNSNVPQDVQATIASIVQPANGKQQRPSSQPVDSHSVSRRLVELWLPFPLFLRTERFKVPRWTRFLVGVRVCVLEKDSMGIVTLKIGTS